jgi:dihydroorotase
MKVLLKAVTIIATSSPFHRQQKDILIADGLIQAIETNLSVEDGEVIEIAGLHVSSGWTDIFSNFADPGDEFKETLETGAAAAAAGGFTDVFVIPNTKPVIHDKSGVEYVVLRSGSLPVNIRPLGAITRNTEGKELAEIYDMRNSGAVAFTDGINPIQSAGLMLKALQYVRSFDGVLIQLPSDNTLAKQGLMNEGVISTRLGLPGKPAIAEELMIARDIELLKYTGSRLHITGISTKVSHQLIQNARSEGLRISCSVSPAHLLFCDEDLHSYDTNLKLNPPLRTREDMLYLRSAVQHGEIDCLASHHLPQDWDNKVCEFEYAKEGMISLQSMFAAARVAGVSAERFIEMQTRNIATIFDLEQKELKANNTANLSLFLPDDEFTLTEKMLMSKSKNSAFVGKNLRGFVVGIINKEQIVISQPKTTDGK